MWLTAEGEVVFEVVLNAPARQLAIAPSGEFGIVRDFEGKWTAYQNTGTVLWKIQASCKPVILSTRPEIICFHDDDPYPKFAFEVFSFQGQRLAAVLAKQDLTAFRLSASENHVLLAETGGRVRVFASNYKLVRSFQSAGEVLDLAYADLSAEPVLGTLALSRPEGQVLELFSGSIAKGEALVKRVQLPAHCEQLEFVDSGKLVNLYGNSPKGQFLIQYSTFDLGMNWQRLSPHYADYSVPIEVKDDWILVGFEERPGAKQTASLAFLDLDGRLRARVPLDSNPLAYMYQFAYSKDKKLIAVATDDQKIAVFEMEKP
jgi:hypothetical protein